MMRKLSRNLGTILSSENQIHLTIYLANRGGFIDLRHNLENALMDSRDVLVPVMEHADLVRLLAPVEALVASNTVLRDLPGSVGIFRTPDFFRVLSIPVEVENGCHVASTFHVKPLFSWMQAEPDCLVVGLGKNAASLFRWSPLGMAPIDVIGYSVGGATHEGHESIDFEWIWSWIHAVSPLRGRSVVVYGEKELIPQFEQAEYRRNAPVLHLDAPPQDGDLDVLHPRIAHLIRKDARARVRRVIDGLREKRSLYSFETNLQRISRAASRGEVKKLIVAQNREIYGKINSATGEVHLHPFDLDHEDDDLLDDLAQRVYLSGGEVVVVPSEDIPERRPILAVI